MLKIRNAAIDDIPIIKECLIDSWVNHALNTPELLDVERMKKSDIVGYYLKAIKDGDSSIVIVAEVDREFAGFLRIDVQEIPSFFKHNKILYLDDVYVLPQFRRNGVASCLIKRAVKIAKERGIKRIQARVYSFNRSMQKLLQTLGYKMPYSTWDKVIK